MTRTLTETRLTLRDAVLHIGDGGFGDAKLDRAIRAAFNRFLRETRIDRTVTQVTIANAASTLDVTATSGAEAFLPGYLTNIPWMSTTFKSVRPISFENLRQLREDSSTASGRPELIAWQSPTLGYLFPTADAEYTLNVPWWKPLTSFDIGTQGVWSSTTAYDVDDVVQGDGDPDALYYRCIAASTNNEPPNATYWVAITGVTATAPASVTINCPDQYFDDVLHTGAKRYLLYGAAHSHPDARGMEQEFRDLIDKAKGDATFSGVWFGNPGAHQSSSYGPGGYI